MVFKLEEHYLLRVLTLSAIPKLMTFTLTTASLTIMLRAVGMQEYGVFVFITALTGLAGLLVDLGLSGVVGRDVSAARSEAPQMARQKAHEWFISRVLLTSLMSIPILASFLWLSTSGIIEDADSATVLLAVAAMLINSLFDVQRRIMAALLAFGHVAINDLIASLLRSLSWIAVALMWPNALGLVIGALASTLLGTIIGMVQLRIIFLDHPLKKQKLRATLWQLPIFQREQMRDMLNYLGISSGGRLFKDIPPVLVKFSLGYEEAGILGTVQRTLEMVSVPFSIMGNALKVRVHEVMNKGAEQVRMLFDMMLRFATISFAMSLGFWFLAEPIGLLLMPAYDNSYLVYSIFAPVVLFRAVADIFALSSDYVGGLGTRAWFLWICAIAQIPFIWVSIDYAGWEAGMICIMGCYGVLALGYFFIASRVLLRRAEYTPAADIPMAFGCVITAAGLTSWLASSPWFQAFGFTLLLIVSVHSIPGLRRIYGNGNFLMFKF